MRKIQENHTLQQLEQGKIDKIRSKPLQNNFFDPKVLKNKLDRSTSSRSNSGTRNVNVRHIWFDADRPSGVNVAQ